MPRWDTARIITESGTVYRQPPAVAQSLLQAGLAKRLFSDPLTVELISVERIGAAFIPTTCKNFIEEYRALSGYTISTSSRSRKPRGSVEKLSLDDDLYVPMPLGV